MTRKRVGIALLLFLPIATACGGGGAEEVVNGGGGGSVVAGFAPDQPSPGPDTASMARGNSSGDVVTVIVNVTDTAGVYGAGFDVTYDPAGAQFEGWSAGTILETGGHTPTYQVNGAQAGLVVVGVSRNGSVTPVDVTGTRPLVRLTFRVKRTGQTALIFGSPQLFGGQVPPQPLPNVQWFGGSLVGS